MAVKKSAGGKKAPEAAASKGKAAVKGAAKKEAPKAAAAPAPKAAAPKKAAVKKAAAAPIKLSTSQTEVLKKIHGATEPAGYRPEKKAEQRTIDALQERKLIKRGAKHKESGTYHYQVSNTGKKHLGSQGGASTGGTTTSGGA